MRSVKAGFNGCVSFARLYLDLDSIAAVGAGAPPEQPVALDKAVGDQVLVLQLDPWVTDQGHHRLVVHHNVAVAGALDHLARPLVHDLSSEVLRPAAGAVQVAALQASHHTLWQRQTANLTFHHSGPTDWSLLGLWQVRVLLVRRNNLGEIIFDVSSSN